MGGSSTQFNQILNIKFYIPVYIFYLKLMVNTKKNNKKENMSMVIMKEQAIFFFYKGSC